MRILLDENMRPRKLSESVAAMNKLSEGIREYETDVGCTPAL